MAAPNSKELEIIVKFREKLQDLNLDAKKNSDMYLLRWLRAREYNLDQSEDMLRKSLKWREENDIDSLTTWTAPDNLTRNYAMDMNSFDKDNSPVTMMQFGKWNLKQMIQSGQKLDYIKYVDQMFEIMSQSMEGKKTASGVPVTQFTMIMDTNGLAMKTLFSFGVVDTIMENLRRLECNHPEVLKAAYVINASRVFTMLFSIVKPLLSQRTFGKVQIYDSDEAKWRPALFAAIARDQLPQVFGGTSTKSPLDSHSNASNGLTRLSLSEHDDNDDSISDILVPVTVGPAKTLPVEIQVDQEGTTLRWLFKTDSHNIGFSIAFKDQEVVSKERFESHVTPVQGSLVCDQRGTYVVLFDNSFSRLRSKALKYRIDLIPPA